MSIRTTEHCDICGKRVDYYDADGDKHYHGIQLYSEHTERKADKTFTTRIVAFLAFSLRIVGRGSYSSFPPVKLTADIICSPACLQKEFDEIINILTEKWKEPDPIYPHKEAEK